MIKVSNLNFAYGKKEVFRDFNIEINNQIFGLIGINGAGKSTLLKLFLGLLRPDDGDLQIDNFDTTVDIDKLLKLVGVLHENPKFPSWIRVYDHLCWLGELRGLARKDAEGQAMLLIKKFDLLDKKNSRVSALSAGLTQRFGIAQAVIGIPKVIFLDEPTANLDVMSRINVLNELKQISRKFDTQIIIFSHILGDLEKFCDAFGVIHDGELKFQDKIINLLNDNYHKEFSVRGEDKNNLSLVIDQLQQLGAKIMDENLVETIIKIETKDQYTSINNMKTPVTISINPVRSLLEQKFIELTGS